MSLRSIFGVLKDPGILGAIALVAVIAAGGGLYREHQEQGTLNARLAGLESEMQALTASLAQSKVLSQESASQIQHIAQEQQTTVANAGSSQNSGLTTAVAEVAPAVVSVVGSKEVPKLEVTYENPFGSDPRYRDFGFQIPVYHQEGTQTQQVTAGTGFIIRSDGYILTNKHVVDDDTVQYTVLLSSGEQKPVKVVYQDQNYDIAVLKIEGSGYPTANLGDSSKLKLGESVAAIGNALGEYSNSVSVGVISGIDRTIEASDQDGNLEELSGVLQTDAAINPGNSGGPLLDLNGNVIGMNVAVVQDSNSIGFALPINRIKQVLAGQQL